MSVIYTVPEQEETPVVDMPAEYRMGLCDRCGFKGQLEVSYSGWGSALTFCAHHGREAWSSLPEGIEITVSDEFFLWEHVLSGEI